MRAACAVLVLLFVPTLVKAEGGLPAEVLRSLKAATVFVKVDVGKASGSGSGFVLKTDKETAYIVTNHHVVRPTFTVIRGRGRLARKVEVTVRDAAISVVLDSGTRKERTIRAIVLAEDELKDLAVLKITDVKGLPVPIKSDSPPELSETMPIYVLGFPFGKALSLSKGNPAITIGKGSVSSLRLNDAGELALVQIDGALNPGNSGGPVVDTNGHLIGIAVARIADSGIGLAIPARELAQMLKGRVTNYHLQVVQRDKDVMKLRVEMRLLDPLGKLRAVTFHYVPGLSTGKGHVSTRPGAKQLKLEIKGQLAAGMMTVPMGKAPTVPVTFQTEYVNGDGKTLLTAVNTGVFRASPDAPVVRLDGPPRGPSLGRDALTAALADLKGDNVFRRRAACDRLAWAQPGTEGKEVLAALGASLADSDAFTRCAAIKAHMNWAGKDGLSTYHELLKSDGNFLARSVLIEGIARLAGASAAPAIAARLPELADRGPASKALKSMGAGAEKAVVAYLAHSDFGARIEACKILKDIGTASSLPALGKASAGLAAVFAAVVESAANEAIRAISARK